MLKPEISDEIPLGKRLQERRKQRGITQEQLAQAAGIPYTTLTKIESGRIKNPSVQAMSRLAEALGISLDDFSLIQTYRGKSALKRVHDDILATLSEGDTMYISGIDEREYLAADKQQIETFIAQIGELKLRQRLLSCEGDTYGFRRDYIEYRWVPKEYFNPNPIYVYNNRIAAIVWEQQQSFIISNALLADAYKKQFLFMWENSLATPE